MKREANRKTRGSQGKAAKKGQVMVLGCLTMLLLALSLMMSFSVANAVHERIRIQSHADAMAFSMAVMEARAMNYIAYSNRATAAAFVSMTSVHAYSAIANSTAQWMQGGMWAMMFSAVLEGLKCTPKTPSHCLHALRILSRAMQYQRAKRNYENRLQQMETPLNEAVEAFVKMANDIHKSQQDAVGAIQKILENGKGNGDLELLGKTNAPCAKNDIDKVGSLNVGEFACAMEGSKLDSRATGHKRPRKNSACPSASSLDNRRRIMTNVVDASRPKFLDASHPMVMQSGPVPLFFDSQFLQELLQDIPQPRQDGMGFNYNVDGWLTDNVCRPANNNSKGATSCARAGDATLFFPQVICDPGVGWVDYASIGSNQSGNNHTPSGAHTGTHNKYKGLFASNAQAPCANGNCFINFRLDSAGNNWGQPAVYAYITQSLRDSTTQDNQCKSTQQPWEINPQREVRIKHGAQPEGVLRMAPSRDGVAVSKALVYFHRKDDWRFPPNLFDPYWRAKLHPFYKGEMARVLAKAGHADANTLAKHNDVPIEGKFGKD